MSIKKIVSVFVCLVMLLGVTTSLTGCSLFSKENDDNSKGTTGGKDYVASVDLEGNYTVNDPEGVEFDTRTVLHYTLSESDQTYAMGERTAYYVIYSKDDQGKYAVLVMVCDTEENASKVAGMMGGKVSGKLVISEMNEANFIALKNNIPNITSFIEQLQGQGFQELK